MDSKAIEAVAALAAAGQQPTAFRPEAEPEGVYWLCHDGKAERVTADPPRRRHVAGDLPSLVAATVRITGEQMGRAAIWVSRSEVTALLFDGDRRDTVSLELEPSPQMKALQAWEGEPKWLDQAALVRVLRNTFRRSTAGKDTVEIFRRLKLNLGVQAEHVHEHGRASAGRAIEAKVTGAKDIPEELTFREDVFAGGLSGIEARVTCTIELDAQSGKVALLPVAGEVEAAWLAAERSLAEQVWALLGTGEGNDFVSVYLGKP